jgi:Ca2+-binding RTX toxin-like protein
MARFAVPLLALTILSGIAAIGASAATVQVTRLSSHGATTGYRIDLRAAPGEANDVTISQETPTTLTIGDRVPLTPGTDCEVLSTLLARCTIQVVGETSFDAWLGDGDDSLDAADADLNFARLLGGPGDDAIAGPLDAIQTIFDGGPGDDLLEGGHGPDLFREGSRRNGSDTFEGGSPTDPSALISDDEVNYGKRRHSLSLSPDGRANDGERGEYDRIGTDVERVVAGSGADRMTGNGSDNSFNGGPGRDVLRGGSGDDELIGDQQIARSRKRQGDVIVGGPGDDRLQGGRGGDRMKGGSGHDSFLTGEDHDRVDAGDGTFDAILCNSGRDRIRHDGADWVASNCGRQRGPLPAHVVPLLWTDGGDRLFLGVGCPFHKGRNCGAYATLELAGQSFRSRPFTLFPGWYGYLMLGLGTRTAEHPDPPLDGAVLTLSSTDARGQVTTQSWPLSAVHRDPYEVPSFLPLVTPPFLTPFP